MKNIIFLLVVCILCSCENAKKSMQDGVTASLEKAIENKTGQKVDLGNVESYEENNGSVNFIAGNKTYLQKDEKLQAVAIFQKDQDGLALSFQLVGAEGKSLILVINHVPEDFKLPLTGVFAVSNSYDGVNPVATAIFMQAGESGMAEAPMPFEGTLKITKLTEKMIEFELDGKGGFAADASSPSAWRPIKASGKLTSPIIQSYGIDKINVLK